MSKFVNITVSTSLSTDFYLEVPDDATEEQIRKLAEKEVILPHTYPSYIDNILKTSLGIKVGGLDSMLKDWNIDELIYIVDGGNDYKIDGGLDEDGPYYEYDYSKCDLHKAVEEQVVLPQNLAEYTERMFNHDLNLKAVGMPKYLKSALEDCKGWTVDDFEVVSEE